MKLSNYTIFICTIIILVVLIITTTTIKLSDDHEKKQIYAMQSKVEYYAKRCYLENKCSGEITLDKLYELSYISEEVVNPVSREIIRHDLPIKYENNKVVINWN